MGAGPGSGPPAAATAAGLHTGGGLHTAAGLYTGGGLHTTAGPPTGGGLYTGGGPPTAAAARSPVGGQGPPGSR